MNHYRKQATFLFAGISVFGLTALVSLLALNPAGTIISRANHEPQIVYVAKPLIDSCNLSYLNCHNLLQTIDSATTGDSVESLDLIAKSYDLNPRLLLTLANLSTSTNPPHINQSEITAIAQTLKDLVRKHNGQGVPIMFDHPTLGLYRLESMNLASYILIRYFSQVTADPQEFRSFLPLPNQTSTFQATYSRMFNATPLDR
jgi:hypothetical protein